VDPMPSADYIISGDEHLVVLGRTEDIRKLSLK